MKTSLRLLSILTIFTFTIPKIVAQNCSPEIYSVPISGDLEQTTDGGYIILGGVYNGPATRHDMVVSKVDFLGNEIWTKEFGGDEDETPGSIRQTMDGGYVFAGATKSFGASNAGYIVKLDENGDEEWSTLLSNGRIISDIRQLPDGTYVLAGKIAGSFFSPGSGLMIKLDIDGNVVAENTVNMWADQWDESSWSWVMAGIGSGSFEAVNITNDGGLIFTGSLWAPTSFYPFPGNLFAVKTDIDLSVIWQNNYFQKEGCEDISTGIAVVQDDEDNFYIADKTSFGGFDCGNLPGKIVKVSPDGEFIWRKPLPRGYIFALTLTDDGNIAGAAANSIYKIDTSGVLLWQTEPVLPGFFRSDGYCMVQTADKGYAFCGRRTGSGLSEHLIIKYDSLGNVCSNFIEGRSYFDTNNICGMDSVDLAFRHLIVEANPGPVFTNTNNTGKYRFQLDSGNYEVTIHPPNDLWEMICLPDSTSYQFDSVYHIADNQDFGLRPLADCPLMKVDVALGRTRTCFDGTAYVYACNEGSETAQNVTVELEWNNQLIVNNSSLPYTQNGNILQFDLSEMAFGECKTIAIEYLVDCDAVIGDTICLSAQIFPNNDCGPLAAESNDIVCQSVRNSYDPNEKQANVNNLLNCWSAASDKIEYTLHFQNTGNDTAYRVMIIDTLPPELDITTLRTGVSSHPYGFQLRESNIAIWIFDNINLVDSTTNEAGSQGFVQFSIQPKVEQDSASINNRVGIYFDANPPIMTEWNIVSFCNPPMNLEIVNVTATNATFCNSNDGSIFIEATGNGVLDYSIDEGVNWQTSQSFDSLALGSYNLVIMGTTGALETYPFNPITIEPEEMPMITDLEFSGPSDCDTTDGFIEIEALGGDTLLFSIDNTLTFQIENLFQQLPGGTYTAIVQNECGQLSYAELIELETLVFPIIDTIKVTPASSANAMDGMLQIDILAPNQPQFSINGGMNWQNASIFSNLAPGFYDLLISYQDGTCQIEEQNIQIPFLTSTNNPKLKWDIRLFPNPTSDKLDFVLTDLNLSDINNVEVYNILGNLVFQQGNLQSERMDVSYLSKGLYFLKIETNVGRKIIRFEKI